MKIKHPKKANVIFQWRTVLFSIGIFFNFLSLRSQDTCFSKLWTNEIAPDRYGEGFWDMAWHESSKSVFLVSSEFFIPPGDSVWAQGLRTYVLDSSMNLVEGFRFYQPREIYGGFKLLLTDDGNFLLPGSIKGHKPNGVVDAMLWKFAPNGDTLWKKMYAFANWYVDVRSAIELPNGDIVAAGSFTRDGNHFKTFILKTDGDGNVLKIDSIGDPIFNTESQTLISTPDGGFIFIGWTNKNTFWNNGSHFLLVKTDPDFNVEWEKNWGNQYTSLIGFDVIKEVDGFWFSGRGSMPFDSATQQGIIFKISWEGDIIDHITFGPKANPYSEISRMVKTPDGNLMAVGQDGGTIYLPSTLFKLSAEGDSIWKRSYLSDSATAGEFRAGIIYNPRDGGFIIAGKGFLQNATSSDLWLLRVDSLGNFVDCNSWLPLPPFQIKIFPNPSHDLFNILIEGFAEEESAQFEMYDNSGKLILLKPDVVGGYSEINVSAFESGIYFYRLIILNREPVCGKLMIY